MRKTPSFSESASFSSSLALRSGTIPYVIPAIVIYMFCMYLADAYQILFWHRQEIESSGKLVILSYSDRKSASIYHDMRAYLTVDIDSENSFRRRFYSAGIYGSAI